MRTILAAAVLAATVASPVIAQSTARVNATVVERDARGRATKVSVEGRVYEVCRPGVEDACINPREAGLNFGNVPLTYWPGRPASERRTATTVANAN